MKNTDYKKDDGRFNLIRNDRRMMPAVLEMNFAVILSACTSNASRGLSLESSTALSKHSLPQIASIRKPLLVKLPHLISENWPSDPLAIQSRNIFAHGGQLKTDIATIHSEPDPAEQQLLTKGFDMGYVPMNGNDRIRMWELAYGLIIIYSLNPAHSHRIYSVDAFTLHHECIASPATICFAS